MHFNLLLLYVYNHRLRKIVYQLRKKLKFYKINRRLKFCARVLIAVSSCPAAGELSELLLLL